MIRDVILDVAEILRITIKINIGAYYGQIPYNNFEPGSIKDLTGTILDSTWIIYDIFRNVKILHGIITIKIDSYPYLL